MDSNRVTVRYARAFIDLAYEKGILKESTHDIRLLYTALNEYSGFADFVLNPGFGSKEKLINVKKLFAAEFNKLTIKFLEMIFENNRENYLKDICRNCIDMARAKEGIIPASLYTARALKPGIIEEIRKRFENSLKTTIEMESEEKPELIGGFVFTIDGQQYDASIASQLSKIKKQLQIK
ncbi:MAG: ATP synthase F1 subunit delta [Prolixibacteraceae bacterium]|nr:ATP synthase F1 subunit delta [Prolixibacteraceae bacterium]